MPMPYDTLDNHLKDSSDIGRAVVPMGMLLAWCVNLGLISREFEQANERAVLRVRMQEIPGSELLIASGGDLQRDLFSEAGQRFLDGYYPRYLEEFCSVFNVSMGEQYGVRESWDNYAKLAQHLTRVYMGSKKTAVAGIFSRFKRLIWH